ncbi:MBL fold metallo-hydrolase [Metabacillus fastidiosus]|uniref:MBL fold metallo-hydrolase n=1 Tax=Metabacillus fastidiosus TaxID=1458 RepID=UPI002DB6DBC7|nr:MBL fold metallo-hydrolase [Metabacillus fastidiosus]MEC2074514.1 MBL fold metallo-hydrolase [Metabacillus fastidiosus]
MLLRYFYDEKLAHASYMVGCQKKGEAVIVDPMRNIELYIQAAEKENMKITGALETHIHADFVAGSRELADRFGATMYISDEGDENWKYENLDGINHVLLKDGDTFGLGKLTFEVMHTPGHTPESISFLLTDGAAADKPIGIFTGDFVFAGDVGRPDLLEKAAGMTGTAETGAKMMYQSIERFKQLPDYMQVWPAHGAGSACGKALGAVPSTTVGYEKQFNWAMQFDNEIDFTQALLDGQPEPPYYFAVMKAVNKSGMDLVKNLPELKFITSVREVEKLIAEGHHVVDTRDSQSFSKGHIKGTINVPFNNSFTNWMGWITDYKKILYLLANPSRMEEMLIALRSIGIDQVLGYAEAKAMIEQSEVLDSYENVSPKEAKKMIDTEDISVIDVRNLSEFNEGHIEGAKHIMVGTLKNRLDEVPNKKLIVQCQAGGRSAIAASILKANGFHNLVNMTGGYGQWVKEVK